MGKDRRTRHKTLELWPPQLDLRLVLVPLDPFRLFAIVAINNVVPHPRQCWANPGSIGDGRRCDAADIKLAWLGNGLDGGCSRTRSSRDQYGSRRRRVKRRRGLGFLVFSATVTLERNGGARAQEQTKAIGDGLPRSPADAPVVLRSFWNRLGGILRKSENRASNALYIRHKRQPCSKIRQACC